MEVLVCRGCCCGTSKHPDVDHAAHLDALREVAPDLQVTHCLGPCRWSNVVVAIEDDGLQHWFAKILGPDELAQITGWLQSPSRPAPAHLERTPPAPDRLRAAQLAAYGRRRGRLPLRP